MKVNQNILCAVEGSMDQKFLITMRQKGREKEILTQIKNICILLKPIYINDLYFTYKLIKIQIELFQKLT